MEKLGFNVENVVKTVLGILGNHAKEEAPAAAPAPNTRKEPV
jgi:hypothetical protein